MKTIFALVPDLMFATRIEDAAKRLGYPIKLIDAPDEIERAMPALVIVALDAPDWESVVASAKRAGARVLAFGSHKNVAVMVAAKNAGCDQVVARSMLAAELPNLLTKWFVEM
ncbi:MAG: hypothetical protein HZC40_19720 [Chloroflexi bacterium]|nr:hypothetical protein [Chloroflexota bacterium]